MENTKQAIIQSSLGSVFTVFGETELEKTKGEAKRLIALSGKVINPGLYEVAEGATLKDVIDMAGGIINNKSFKAAQLGFPFGAFITTGDLNTELDFKLFEKATYKNIIILSDEDCIVQFSKFYVEYLLGNIEQGKCEESLGCKNEIARIGRIFDRISK